MRTESYVRAYRPSEAAPRVMSPDISRSSLGKRQPQTPERIAGAVWQAGVTPGNDRLRVLLDGNFVPLAFAASIAGGWVMRYLEPIELAQGAHRVPADPLAERVIGLAAAFTVLHGQVRLVRSDDEF